MCARKKAQAQDQAQKVQRTQDFRGLQVALYGDKACRQFRQANHDQAYANSAVSLSQEEPFLSSSSSSVEVSSGSSGDENGDVTAKSGMNENTKENSHEKQVAEQVQTTVVLPQQPCE